ncbi:hypothetical protein ACI01nite_25090 [Acetobacter cibinongensis]|uniref:Phage associated-antirepressor BRO n=1 Tax=Acetobacter cibinongensis TaxID=146475 RepID=A0A0D6N7R0_9PROT|nr:phage antirepressor KilAC domain-containing protein [Acetobacter cibinongensis]GAN61598.1 phage associated-antirepressor BRO [Acetobacter cibinongensis]GBQ17637.1 prophage antirepressor [Acetobacter cibinongensis NRIC 0482]GEL59907.1 hypothetical protein ACI01nite_25090 [Acetobacter cibinongensis]
MTENLIPFSFEGTEVRVLDRDGIPHWILSDVCKVLEIANAPHAANRLDDDEKATIVNSDSHAGSGAQSYTIINESGLWSLVLTSRKPAAKRFKKWITSEVIPSIRQTGGYMAATPEETPEELALRAMTILQATVERQKLQLAEVLPKVEALEKITGAEGSYAPTDAAKTLGIRPTVLFKYLRGEARWLYRRPGMSEDIAYQEKLQRGLMEHKITIVQRSDGSEKTITRARITPKGLCALAQIFNEPAA